MFSSTIIRAVKLRLLFRQRGFMSVSASLGVSLSNALICSICVGNKNGNSHLFLLDSRSLHRQLEIWQLHYHWRRSQWSRGNMCPPPPNNVVPCMLVYALERLRGTKSSHAPPPLMFTTDRRSCSLCYCETYPHELKLAALTGKMFDLNNILSETSMHTTVRNEFEIPETDFSRRRK
jgi:hypothetical protein